MVLIAELTQSLPNLGMWCAFIGGTILVSAAILYWCLYE